ncbi:dihydroxyacetone kinase DhaM subunit [Selenomonas sp. WCT3]|uniref:phosphoenolpyruvate--glycerone phosphotransferase n=1 Tax=Selenomonas ruminis TaxID=2593411 RepID=A0A5D6W6S7_9FIRM|nr:MULTISPECIES: dihydroxyacetone kinase phosphoryl donor subunit DhaM [unclassified Selenomonas]MBQ1868777.1 PTS-dependent dihydroxyacetone kinase phosphotransferase subunit DhaM [Selenomonas sp.]MCR5439142.1 PTS-dependent dihydroxyacetone kinase phosphotransferase subunit DhaM [Selenomonas sp.]TYZ22585.1 PTS-dependent dihydroxyacetone kinase phosphotransferase subunit DhaM [Selenomonas sp. mPRGC5]SDG01997.1 dihydroxyacetone kinase DhaM subunit [Selenomonas ruminantium]
MVGIVIVSHSQKLAEGVKELAEMMARDVQIAAAGGLDDGMLGTSYGKIMMAVEDVCGRDGAVVLMDMGSAVMTAELVQENLKDDQVKLVDCPLVEGAVMAAVAAAGGADVMEVVRQAQAGREMMKLQ